MDDIRRLCWLWEWDGKKAPSDDDDEDNPFLEDSPKREASRQWPRGADGLIITPTTYLPKSGGKRLPAYGIGIEIEMDIDKQMTGGMAAVARWAAGGEERLRSLDEKLRRWVLVSGFVPNAPSILIVFPCSCIISLIQFQMCPSRTSLLLRRLQRSSLL